MTLLFSMAVLFTLSGFLLLTLTVALRQQTPTRIDQDAKAATAAAQAGLDDYLSRLTNNQSYWQSTDGTNTALTSTGALIPGSSSGARFRYEVVTAPNEAGSGGRLVVRATGEVNGTNRSLTATFQPGSFLNYVYLTDKESLSPLYTGSGSSACTKRWWQGRNSGSGCGEIQFGFGDRINGPMHTNDTPMIGGTITFAGRATTSTMTPYGSSPTTACTGTSCYRVNGSASFTAYRPEYGALVQIPSSNTELADNAAEYGCVYYGATHITFNGTTMTVYSPGTTVANRTQCFNPANRSSAQTVALAPAIYVRDLTSACTQTNQQARGFPLTRTIAGYTYTESTGGVTPSYTCNLGTAYLRGSVNGNVTVGSTQDIIVTGNLTYTNDPLVHPESTDVLGLVPGHTVWVYHPVSGSTELLDAGQRVNRIDAAILTIQDSFIVQYYNQGSPLGALTVYGSLAQNYRGTVGTGGSTIATGYSKDYRYDSRFASGAIQPTYFLKPLAAQWEFQSVTDG
ncbi:MAG: hypothetical protein JNL54_01230 [Kineosporiaceae bacterium]|nr:hypothetical protein [Kineosporiaceae bacterium]